MRVCQVNPELVGSCLEVEAVKELHDGGKELGEVEVSKSVSI